MYSIQKNHVDVAEENLIFFSPPQRTKQIPGALLKGRNKEQLMMWWWLLCDIFIKSPLVVFFFSVIENCSRVLFTVPWEKTFQEETWWFKNYFFPSPFHPSLSSSFCLRAPCRACCRLLVVVWLVGRSSILCFFFGPNSAVVLSLVLLWGPRSLQGGWRWSCATFCTRETVKLPNKSCSSGGFLFYSPLIYTLCLLFCFQPRSLGGFLRSF